jgi:Icc-related predicted phosphoesterase
MASRLEIFYASDIHGSERVFRKFLNAAAFYKVRAIVFGGDLTGKAIVPFVETSPGVYQAEVSGTGHSAAEGSALEELEQFVRDRGAYPYRTTPDEMAALAGDPDLLRQTFSRLMLATAEKWVTLADERLRAAGIPALMMPGNDDEPEVKQILAQGDWITDAEDQLVDLGGYQVISFGWATTTPWHRSPSPNWPNASPRSQPNSTRTSQPSSTSTTPPHARGWTWPTR